MFGFRFVLFSFSLYIRGFIFSGLVRCTMLSTKSLFIQSLILSFTRVAPRHVKRDGELCHPRLLGCLVRKMHNR